MKIALLWPDYWPYGRRGTERMLHDIAYFLADRGHEVDILASKPGRAQVTRNGGVTVYHLPQVNHPVLRRLRPNLRFDMHGLMVAPLLLRKQYDLIHAFVYVYGPALKLARWLRGTPMAYHVTYVPPCHDQVYDRELVKLCLYSGAPVRVFSRYCAAYMESQYGIDTWIVPPTVDMDVFRPSDDKFAQPTILYTADLTHGLKGPHILARAFNRVREERPETRLLLAGPLTAPKAELDGVMRLFSPEALGGVEIAGPGSLSSLPSLYGSAAVTVLPSLGEPFGMVLTESLACGTPVVGSRSGAIPEIITDPAVGTLFDRVDDPDASASYLAGALLESLDLAERPGTGDACREHARRFSWEAAGDRFEEMQDAATGRERVKVPV